MKKVVCIDARNPGNDDWHGPDPKEGDVLTVMWEGVLYDIYSYQFVEYGHNYAYSAWRFAPLSDLDETTLVNEEWEEKVCVPVNDRV